MNLKTKRILSIVIFLSGTIKLCAMQKESTAQDLAQPSTQNQIIFSREEVLGKYLQMFVSEHPQNRPVLRAEDCCAVGGSFSKLGAGLHASKHDSNVYARAARATLNLVNSLKYWLVENLNFHATKVDDLTLNDVISLMDDFEKNTLMYQAPDCIEILLRFICAYYPRDAETILKRIGIQVNFLNVDKTAPREDYVHRQGVCCSNLQFTKKYFKCAPEMEKENFLHALYTTNSKTLTEFFERDFFSERSSVQLPILFHGGPVSCFTVHGIQKIKDSALNQVFVARPGPNGKVGWFDRITQCYQTEPLIGIVLYLRSAQNYNYSPAEVYPELATMGQALRDRMNQESVFDPVKEHIVCTIQ